MERLTKSRGEAGLIGIPGKRLRVVDKQRQANATLEGVAIVCRILCRNLTVCGHLDTGRVNSRSNQLITNEFSTIFREFQVVSFIAAFIGKTVKS